MYSAGPSAALPPEVISVVAALDPVLEPLGFAPGQCGASDGSAQVVFCRGLVDSTDGECVDLVVDLAAAPEWRISDVRYWGFPSDTWRHDVPKGVPLAQQLGELSGSLPAWLRGGG